MSEKGTVYFFTGLSGAGKTTVGGLFHDRLKAKKPTVILMDGDQTRPVFCEQGGYTAEAREYGSFRFFRVAKWLADQGMDVVCCAICMHSSVRAWNRENIENYKEVYVKVTSETLLKRNKKGLYTSGTNVVGVDIPFDEPTSPDLILMNDGEETPLQAVERVEQYFGV